MLSLYETVRMSVSLTCQDTTEGQDAMMQQHLNEFGYYYCQLRIKYFFKYLDVFSVVLQ